MPCPTPQTFEAMAGNPTCTRLVCEALSAESRAAQSEAAVVFTSPGPEELARDMDWLAAVLYALVSSTRSRLISSISLSFWEV